MKEALTPEDELVGNMARLIARFKQSWARQLEPAAIEDACREAEHLYRKRRLHPVATLQLFLLQVLHGNTSCQHLPHLAGMKFSASAYCQARARLALDVFQSLLRRMCAAFQQDLLDEGRWRGHRTFLLDGSAFSMPDTPSLQARFGQPGAQTPGCGFPVAHLLACFHAGTGLVTRVLTAPLRTHDMAQAAEMHADLRKGDVLLADRGFCSFAHIALVLRQTLHAVFRVHQRVIVDFTPHRPHAVPGRGNCAHNKGLPRSRWRRQLGVQDQLVECLKPVQRPKWMSEEDFAALPASITVRELRYRVGRRGFRVQEVTLVTTLLDAEAYPLKALAELYSRRWEVETHLAELKRTMKMDVLHCETPDGVLKELAVFAMAYNLVRCVMLESAARQGVAVDRVSFIDALRWLQAFPDGKPIAELHRNPSRPNRLDPRVRKRRPKQYPLMKRPRAELRQVLECQGVTP